MVRRGGAKEVHLLISSPPIRFPDFYGINTPRQNELIAARMSVEDIKSFVGADSLYYLSYPGLIAATGLPEYVFSTSCFTGVYPIDIRERSREINFDIYQHQQVTLSGNSHKEVESKEVDVVKEVSEPEVILYTSH